jgi:aldose 1-epimerase
MTVRMTAIGIASAVGFVLFGVVLGMAATGGEANGPEARQGAFSWKEEKDPASGWTIWRLSYDDPNTPRNSQSIRVCPEAGANLFSYTLGDTELLRPPTGIRGLQGRGAGTLVLYPTPNRVRGGRFSFEGRDFTFSDTGETTLHLLVLALPWKSEPPAFETSDGAVTAVAVKAWIDFEPGSSQFARFPIRNRLTLRYRLSATGLRADATVENRDTQRLPFGFALHPYFRLLGARDETYLQVPAEKKMEATADLLPTGTLLSLDGAPFDLRQPRKLSELALDDVFLGMNSTKVAGFEARDIGLSLTLRASDDFTHIVVFTPPGRPFFCIENQTCSTDAHNLYSRGLKTESHLLVVEPGAAWTGWVEFHPRWTGK